MRQHFLVTIALLASIGVTQAQPEKQRSLPDEITFDSTLTLTPGQSKVLHFDRHIVSIYVPGTDIVHATAQTDRMVIVTAALPGTASLLVLGDSGEKIFYGNIVVAPPAAEASAEEGHPVRIMNWRGGKSGGVQTGGVQINMGQGAPASSGPDESDYFCTSTGCGQVASDKK